MPNITALPGSSLYVAPDTGKFERLVTELSTRFISLPSSEIDRVLCSALEMIADALDLETASLIDFNPASSEVTSLHRYARPTPGDRAFMSWSWWMPWVAEKLRRGETVVLPRVSRDLPPDATFEREIAERTGGKSSLVVPLMVGGEVLAALGFTCYERYCDWPDDLVARIRTAGQIFGNALARKRMDEALRNALKELSDLKDRLAAENDYLQDELARKRIFDEVVAQSSVMRDIMFQAGQVALTDATVLILGETGTGKGLVAKEIHRRSRRRDNPFVTVDCSTLPAPLIESELFGREKGSFTDATSQMGRFALADKGTLFLDEVGNIPLEIQPKLLRVIQEGEFERVGNPRTVKVDVRIIAATNQDLQQAIRQGRFREDLFYRLNVFPLRLPPLRDRPDDIPALVEHATRKYGLAHRKPVLTISRGLFDTLQAYRWPGNVRELQNVVERMVITSPGAELCLAEPLGPVAQAKPESETRAEETPVPEQCVQTLAESERTHILRALERSNWLIEGPRGAAQALGLNASTLRGRMRKLKIRRP